MKRLSRVENQDRSRMMYPPTPVSSAGADKVKVEMKVMLPYLTFLGEQRQALRDKHTLFTKETSKVTRKHNKLQRLSRKADHSLKVQVIRKKLQDADALEGLYSQTHSFAIASLSILLFAMFISSANLAEFGARFEDYSSKFCRKQI
jgi:hypothetical protein